MVFEALSALLGVFEVLRPAFTQPGFDNALVVFAGWVLTSGCHAVTEALVATDVARRRHHEAFHRFFSRGTWEPDDLGLLLFRRLRRFVPMGTMMTAAIDDTLATKKGPKVFGIGSHLDAVRSTKAVKVFAFGHVWVTLCVIVRVPFSQRPWALPVLFRLYRNEKECKAKGHVHRKKTELAREMLNVFIGWVGEESFELAMDSAYCNDTVMRDLPPSVVVLGAMRPDAVLTTSPVKKPGKRGRRPVRGAPLPKPAELAKDDAEPWRICKAQIYGRQRTLYYKTLLAQWYRASGVRLLRIVIVRIDEGAIPIRVFFCTDPNRSVVAVLEAYARRWPIEVCFRDLKQLLGFGDSSARKREAVERTAPFVGYIYTLLVIWFIEGAHRSQLAAPPVRPWYPHKRGLCFADILRAAQRALAHLDVLDPARSVADLRESAPRRRETPPGPIDKAA